MAAFAEIAVAFVLVLCSIFLCTINPRKWLVVDAYVTIAFGCCDVFFSREILSTAVPWKHDGHHVFFLQAGVMLMIMPSFVALMTRGSSDARVVRSLLLSRVVCGGTRLLVLITAHFGTDGIFSDAHLYLSVAGVFAWFLVNAVQFGKFNEVPTSAPHMSHINYWLIADAVWSFMNLVPDFLAADFAFHLMGLQSDFLHQHLLRVGATTNLGSAIVSASAVQFTGTEDKCAVFKSRIVTGLFTLGALAYGHVCCGVASSLQEILMLSFRAGPSLLGLGGLYAAKAHLKAE